MVVALAFNVHVDLKALELVLWCNRDAANFKDGIELWRCHHAAAIKSWTSWCTIVVANSSPPSTPEQVVSKATHGVWAFSRCILHFSFVYVILMYGIAVSPVALRKSWKKRISSTGLKSMSWTFKSSQVGYGN